MSSRVKLQSAFQNETNIRTWKIWLSDQWLWRWYYNSIPKRKCDYFIEAQDWGNIGYFDIKKSSQSSFKLGYEHGDEVIEENPSLQELGTKPQPIFSTIDEGSISIFILGYRGGPLVGDLAKGVKNAVLIAIPPLLQLGFALCRAAFFSNGHSSEIHHKKRGLVWYLWEWNVFSGPGGDCHRSEADPLEGKTNVYRSMIGNAKKREDLVNYGAPEGTRSACKEMEIGLLIHIA